MIYYGPLTNLLPLTRPSSSAFAYVKPQNACVLHSHRPLPSHVQSSLKEYKRGAGSADSFSVRSDCILWLGRAPKYPLAPLSIQNGFVLFVFDHPLRLPTR
ncbi:hypothetical protein CPSG_04061 [Coccidioides posadasii str. Silveira]|uniref:Uncharacterized protein n=1 Tax=Coccidioides posadasii (strain RMSCC 757 / Silveira) TaxID=443226 RepID=E9D1K3_COCPS|nr:hypothetical protein CPSG_04061 [Coccidioides posadasii str. Silveira]